MSSTSSHINSGFLIEVVGGVNDARAIEAIFLAAVANWRHHYSGHQETISKVNNALIKIGQPAVEFLNSILINKTGELRRVAAILLGEIGDVYDIEPLIITLEDDDLDIRYAAIHALGKIGNPTATKFLTALLQDEDSSIRCAAIHALGKIGDPYATEFLIAALEDNKASVRKDAAEALGKVGAHTRKAILGILQQIYESVPDNSKHR